MDGVGTESASATELAFAGANPAQLALERGARNATLVQSHSRISVSGACVRKHIEWFILA